MRDFINIGSSPAAEDCVGVGVPNYSILAKRECNRFIKLIRATLGPEPEGAELRIKGFDHDYGRYYEVVCWYDDALPESQEYALKCESEAPEYWDEGTADYELATIGRVLESK